MSGIFGKAKPSKVKERPLPALDQTPSEEDKAKLALAESNKRRAGLGKTLLTSGEPDEPNVLRKLLGA